MLHLHSPRLGESNRRTEPRLSGRVESRYSQHRVETCRIAETRLHIYSLRVLPNLRCAARQALSADVGGFQKQPICRFQYITVRLYIGPENGPRTAADPILFHLFHLFQANLLNYKGNPRWNRWNSFFL